MEGGAKEIQLDAEKVVRNMHLLPGKIACLSALNSRNHNKEEKIYRMRVLVFIAITIDAI